MFNRLASRLTLLLLLEMAHEWRSTFTSAPPELHTPCVCACTTPGGWGVSFAIPRAIFFITRNCSALAAARRLRNKNGPPTSKRVVFTCHNPGMQPISPISISPPPARNVVLRVIVRKLHNGQPPALSAPLPQQQ